MFIQNKMLSLSFIDDDWSLGPAMNGLQVLTFCSPRFLVLFAPNWGRARGHGKSPDLNTTYFGIVCVDILLKTKLFFDMKAKGFSRDLVCWCRWMNEWKNESILLSEALQSSSIKHVKEEKVKLCCFFSRSIQTSSTGSPDYAPRSVALTPWQPWLRKSFLISRPKPDSASGIGARIEISTSSDQRSRGAP